MKTTPKVITNERLMREWDYEKNNEKGLFPDKLTVGSGRKASWKCSKEHEWDATINSRNGGRNCPFCNGKEVIIGVNDFASKYPEIALEWHPTKNGIKLPSQVHFASGVPVWWLCKNNHEYQCKPRDRSRNNGCPICLASQKTSFPEQAVYYYIKQCFPDAITTILLRLG